MLKRTKPGMVVSWMPFSSLRRNVLGTTTVLFFFLAGTLFTQAANSGQSVLNNSVREVPMAPQTGAIDPHRAFIFRKNLSSAESDAVMEFGVALKMRNFAELQARVASGEIISAQEMAAKYDPLETDYLKVASWLTSQGFKITRQDEHHMGIFASGKVSQIQKALQVNFARVTFEGSEYTSAITSPTVADTVSSLLVGINGLQPHIRAHKHLVQPQQIHPNASGGTASYIPSQIAQAYNVNGLYGANIYGAGQSIAIVIDTFPATRDLISFWQIAGVNQSISNIQFIQVVAGTLATPSGEESLDVEWSSALAPQAKVRVYATTNLSNTFLDEAYQQIYTDATTHPEYGIHQMSMSYGEGETYTTNSQVQTDDQYFAKLASAGVTIFASSGDGGSTPGSSGSPSDETGPLQVETPASDPNVTGVGGTTLVLDINSNESSETVWNNTTGASGGGVSIYFSRPTWQTGTGVNTSALRQVPDIACTADPNFGAVYVLNGASSQVGGTSWSSPNCAAFCALINQARANAGLGSIGLLGPQIYPLIGTANFRDITSGNNATSKSSGNYSATTGYDKATGIGVPLVTTLAKTIAGTTNLEGVQVLPVSQSVLPGQGATFTVSAGGSPTGYQWQRMPIGSTTWSNLSNSGSYGGATSTTLTVSNSTTTMSGDQFQCVVTYSGTSVTSIPSSVLIVDTPLIITTLAGSAGISGNVNATGTSSQFSYPSGIALDTSGNLYIADYGNSSIRKVTPAGVVTSPYTQFSSPNAIAADGSNNLYVADPGSNTIRKIVISSGTVTTLASSTVFNSPEGIAVDSSGNIYVADTGNNIIRKITSGGTVSTLAGKSGTAGYHDATGTAALFNNPTSVAVDSSGNVYVTDFNNFVIRKITSSGVVTTLAGQAGIGGYMDGPNGKALFNAPNGLAMDASNNLYVTDSLIPFTDSTNAGNNLIRKITSAGVVSTVAGDAGITGSNDGTGAAAQFYSVQAIGINNTTGTLYIADTYNQTIRAGIAGQTISVNATQPTASVFGPVAGQFTVTRAGNTASNLTVNYTVGGTAVSGIDYTALPGSITIPAGTNSATIAVNPLTNSSAASNPTVVLTLSASGTNAYVLGSPGAATVSITEPTPYQSWKLTEFGSSAYVTTISGDLADPNHNGVPNLLEYAFGANPLATGSGSNNSYPQESVVQISGSSYLSITYTQINTDPNLTYAVQVTSDLTLLTDQWHSGSQYTTVVSQQVNGNTTQVTVRDNVPISQSTMRFIRVQVTESSP